MVSKWKLFLATFLLFSMPGKVMGNGETISPNMSLPVPAQGVTVGPDWANDINASLGIIDSHNHCTGEGVQVPTCGININADLSFLGNNATGVNSVEFNTKTGSTVNLSIYSNGVDLFYVNASGSPIQITANGGVNVSAGNIQNLPSTPIGGAGISWGNSQGTFSFFGDSGTTKANTDQATIIMRYIGSYPTPAGNYISFQAPSSLATGYAYTFPATLPGTSGAFFTLNTSGGAGYTNVDNSTLKITSNVLAVPTGGIATAQLADASVTDAKLAATNYTNSGASGGFTVPVTATPALVTNQQVTLTATSGRPIWIGFQPDTNTSNSFIQIGDSAVFIGIYKDGTLVGGGPFQALSGSVGGGTSYNIPVGSIWYLDLTPTAGSHTYEVRANENGGGTVDSIISWVQLVAFEIK